MAQFGSLIVEGQSTFLSKAYTKTQPAGTDNDTIATTAFVTTAIYNAFHPTVEDNNINNNENNIKENN